MDARLLRIKARLSVPDCDRVGMLFDPADVRWLVDAYEAARAAVPPKVEVVPFSSKLIPCVVMDGNTERVLQVPGMILRGDWVEVEGAVDWLTPYESYPAKVLEYKGTITVHSGSYSAHDLNTNASKARIIFTIKREVA